MKDLSALLQLFRDTIRVICKRDYSPDQLEAWMAAANDQERWERAINEQYFLVAHSEVEIWDSVHLHQAITWILCTCTTLIRDKASPV